MYSSGGFRPHLGLLRRLGPQLLASRAPAGGVLLRARRPLQQHSRASYHSGSGRTTRTLPSAVGPHPARAAATTTAPVTGRYYLVLRRGSGLITVCSLLALALQHPGAGCAAGGDGRPPRRRPAAEEDEEDDVEARLRRALDAALGPLGGEISFGCIVGFTAGYALKKASWDGI